MILRRHHQSPFLNASFSSLLKNLEIGAFPVFLPWVWGGRDVVSRRRPTPPVVWECGSDVGDQIEHEVGSDAG